MANIVLKDKNGANIAYTNVDYVSFQTLEGGTVRFNEGDIRVIPVEELPTEDIKEEVLYKIETTEDENIKIAFYMYENGEWAEYTVGGGVVDVAEFPTDNIEQDKIYRIIRETTKTTTEIWLNLNQDRLNKWALNTNPVSLVTLELLSNDANDIVMIIHEVDSLPEVGEPSMMDYDTHICTVHYYIIANDHTSEVYTWDGGWEIFSDYWYGPYNGIVTDLADVTEEGYYIVKRQVSEVTTTIYGIPNEGGIKTFYEHDGVDGWKELGVGGGDGAIIDVTELPIENIEQDKIYRVTNEGTTEIYLKLPDNPIMTLAEFFQSYPNDFPPIDNCITHLIESLEDFNFDTIIPYDASGTDLHVYVDIESGSAFADFGDGDGVFDVIYDMVEYYHEEYKGIISDPNDLSNYQYAFGYIIVPPCNGYGIPDESNDKDIFKYSSEIGWEKLGVAGERKETLEVYITDGNERCLTFAEYMQIVHSNALGHSCPLPRITYEIVDEIPAYRDVAYEDRINVLPGDEEGKEWGFKCFILSTTGEPYFAYYIEGLFDGCESVSAASKNLYGVSNLSYKGFISDPAEIELNTNMEIFTLLKVVEGSNIVIDVDKLPMASISNDKVYRIVQKVPEVWVALDPYAAALYGCSNPTTLVDAITTDDAQNQGREATVNIHFVDQLPDVGEPEMIEYSDTRTRVYNYYFSTSNTDDPLFVYNPNQNKWQNAYWGSYMGTITSPVSINKMGYYLLKNGTETRATYGISSDCCVQVYKDGVWTTIWGEPILEIPDKEVENEVE